MAGTNVSGLELFELLLCAKLVGLCVCISTDSRRSLKRRLGG